MSSTDKTGRAIYESFKNRGVRLGYISAGVFTGLTISLPSLPYLGEDMNFTTLCTGIGAVALIGCTLGVQYKLVKASKKRCQL